MKTILAILIVAIATVTSASNKLPSALQGVDVVQRLDAQVPMDLTFKNESGNQVRIGDLLDGKPAILTLVYYECPMLCTQVLNGVTTSLRPLKLTAGEEFNIITVSFNPQETPELAAAKKKVYLEDYARKDAGKGWFFLTGTQDSIEKLTEAVGFKYRYDPQIKQYAHSTAIMILTPQGRIARYFYGIEYSTRDVRLALVEASENKIGSLADKVLLYCFHYDPSQGRYSATVVNIIRGGGILTVLSLGIFILRMRRKETANHV